MMKFLRVLTVIVANLITLPIQLVIGAIYITSKLTKSERNEICDVCEAMCETGQRWVTDGRFTEGE